MLYWGFTGMLSPTAAEAKSFNMVGGQGSVKIWDLLSCGNHFMDQSCKKLGTIIGGKELSLVLLN